MLRNIKLAESTLLLEKHLPTSSYDIAVKELMTTEADRRDRNKHVLVDIGQD